MTPSPVTGEEGRMEHTKLPWKVSAKNPSLVLSEGYASEGIFVSVYVADVFGASGDDDEQAEVEAEANARLIVRSVNNHARLVAALEKAQHEALHALAWLEDLEASDNEATQPESTQATGYFIAVAGLRAAVEEARAVLSASKGETE